MSTTGFGARTDYFGLADTNWELQSSTKSPESSAATVADIYGDIQCEKRYENTETVECVYVCNGPGDATGNVELPSGFIAGLAGDGYIITGGNLATSNTERPTLTVTGEESHGSTEGMRYFDFVEAVGEIRARKVPTYIGLEKAAGTHLQSCNVAFSTEVTRTNDKDGEIAVIDLHAGRLESVLELQSCQSSPAIGPLALTWTRQQEDQIVETNTDFATITVSLFLNLEGSDET